LHTTGDQFLEVIKTHVDAEGSMSEQFDRVTGYMRGAEDLTWSYGAFLQAARARKVFMGL
jgi:glucoamylase